MVFIIYFLIGLGVLVCDLIACWLCWLLVAIWWRFAFGVVSVCLVWVVGLVWVTLVISVGFTVACLLVVSFPYLLLVTL